jgi:hypothetical protein
MWSEPELASSRGECNLLYLLEVGGNETVGLEEKMGDRWCDLRLFY